MPPISPSSQAVLETLLKRNRVAKPDGRPLYRYNARRQELNKLRHALSKELGWPTPRRWTAMGFCLWTSEWWRRNFKGGPWKWEPLLDELGHPEFAPDNTRYLELQNIISDGCDAWQREVLRLGSSRRFLATLACEGGLPLRLLKKDTHLRTYIRAVMEEYNLFRSSNIQAQELAERTRRFLPRSLRQHVVYELVGQLVCRIWRLQQLVGESATPVSDLDRICPDWRDELPVRLSDDIAGTLLNGLLLDAAEIARGGPIRVRWNVEVIHVSSDQWEARGSFRMPATINAATFNTLFGRSADACVPDHFDLCVQVHGGTLHPLAIVTRRMTATDPEYGVELLPPARKHHASYLEQPRELMARSLDRCFSTSDFPGAGGLTALPWVFAPAMDSDAEDDGRMTSCRLVGQGSIKIREPWGLVATPLHFDAEAQEGSSAQDVGRLRNGNRLMYRVTGRVAFADSDGSRVVVETGAQSSTGDVEYKLDGAKQAAFARNSSPRTYLGRPRLWQWRDGVLERLPTASLQWKSDTPGSHWEPYDSVRGNGVLRYTREGEVCYRTRLCVLPRDAKVEVRPSSDPQCGHIDLRGFENVIVAVKEPAGVSTACHASGAGHRLELIADDAVPREVTVITDWHGQGRAQIRLPFPTKRAAFIDAKGDELAYAVTLTADRLTGVRAEVVIPGTAEFSVQGQYSGRDARELRHSHGLVDEPMEEISPGYHVLDMARVQFAVEARLSRSDDLDGKVAMSVFSNQKAGSLPPNQLKVGHFDLDLQTLGDDNPAEFRLVAVETGQAGVSQEELDEIVIEAFPLTDPHMRSISIPLDRRPDAQEWFFPEMRPNVGPYLITGRQGEWQRARPLTWPVAGTNAKNASKVVGRHMTVEEAYDQWTGNPEDLELFRSVAHGLASQPDRDGRAWELAFAYLDMTDLPVQVFPLLRALMETREACAMAAVIATPSQFDLLWEGMMAFPFAWWQVPMACWRTAFTKYWEHMRSEMEALDDRDRADSILTEELCSRLRRLKKRLPGLCPAFDFLGVRILGDSIPSTSARIVNPQMLDWLQEEYSKHRRECLARMSTPPIPRLPQVRNWIRGFRTSPSNSWSDCLFVNRVGPFSIDERADYADAPAMTAAAVLSGCEMPSDLARAIREVREDQAEWFDEVLCLAQQIAFGRQALE